jgi:hypothetical protein
MVLNRFSFVNWGSARPVRERQCLVEADGAAADGDGVPTRVLLGSGPAAATQRRDRLPRRTHCLRSCHSRLGGVIVCSVHRVTAAWAAAWGQIWGQ